jgi:hypothetical protein
MIVISKQATRARHQAETEQHPLVQLGLICAAALFVSALFLTYGIDLSPGLF